MEQRDIDFRGLSGTGALEERGRNRARAGDMRLPHELPRLAHRQCVAFGLFHHLAELPHGVVAPGGFFGGEPEAEGVGAAAGALAAEESAGQGAVEPAGQRRFARQLSEVVQGAN